jgi:MFS family permease
MGLAGFGWGMLSDRYGPRVVVFAGSLLLGLACILASRASSLLQFQLAYGVLLGAATASFFAPVISATAASFEKRRNLAVSLVSAGVGVAPLTLSPLVAWLVSHYDWRTTLLIVGLLGWAVTLPAVWFVRVAPGIVGASAQADLGTTGASTLRQALGSRAFIVMAAAYFACCAAHSGPIFHTVSYAVGCGLSVTAAVTIYSMEGAAGLGGRLLFGVLGDRYGAKPVLVAGLLVQGVAAASYLAVSQLDGFYAVAIVFGMAYGGTMPLYASLAREAFAPRILGAVLGATALISSLGMALGPLVGGWLYDHYGSYTWLYIGSMAAGLAAAAIALLFPSARKNSGAGVLQPALQS